MTGGWRSGRERKFHACPAGADAAFARARGAGSQPRVPPSATQAAPPVAVCRNLFRVILGSKLLELSRLALDALSPAVSRWAADGRYPTTRFEPAGYVDALAELFAFQVRSDSGARQCQLSGRLFRDICRGIDTVAQLAVDLDYERYLRGLDQGLLLSRPRLLVHRVLLPHLGPQLLGVVRRERCEYRDEGPQGFVPLVVPDAASYREQVVGVSKRGDGSIGGRTRGRL